jgi:hypothetical protein
VSIENDTLTQSSRAISRGRELYLTPPEPEDEICPRCLRDTEDHAYGAMGVCRKCALCGGYGECRYSDCGAEEAFDAGWTDEQLARAEEQHLEDGRDSDRGLD